MGPIYVGDHNELTDPQNELVTRLQECCEVGLLWALVWSELTFGVA